MQPNTENIHKEKNCMLILSSCVVYICFTPQITSGETLHLKVLKQTKVSLNSTSKYFKEKAASQKMTSSSKLLQTSHASLRLLFHVFVLQTVVSFATHFRGGTAWWSPVSNYSEETAQVSFYKRQSP